MRTTGNDSTTILIDEVVDKITDMGANNRRVISSWNVIFDGAWIILLFVIFMDDEI